MEGKSGEPGDEELATEWRRAETRGDFDMAFDRAQKLLQSIRARNDRRQERDTLLRFAGLLERSGDPQAAERTRRYLVSGFPGVARGIPVAQRASLAL